MGCAGLGWGLLGRGQLAAHLACLVSCQLARFGNEMWKKQYKEKRKMNFDSMTTSRHRYRQHMELGIHCKVLRML